MQCTEVTENAAVAFVQQGGMDFVALTITAAAAASLPSTLLQHKRPDTPVCTPRKFALEVLTDTKLTDPLTMLL